jgi:ParB family transcriptional regulator, chromosome partitioning protein
VAKVHGLGRGLDALIPAGPAGGDVEHVPVERVRRNPHQPRTQFDDEQLTELADSIRLHGVLQPIVVRSLANGEYELIAGERRLRAARLAGLSRVPAIVRDSTGGDQLQLALIENLQRADLNPMEQAAAFRELADRFGMTHEVIARRVGRSRVAISNALRLLDLAAETQQAILDGRISEGHGRALAAISIPELQRAVLEIVISRQLSVRQTEELVRRGVGDGKGVRPRDQCTV